MFSRIPRFVSFVAVALLACASAVTIAVTQAVSTVAAGIGTAFSAFTRAIVKAASNLPSLAPKRPTGTAAERMRLIPSAAYARSQQIRRRPTVLPNWRMCASV